VGETDPVKGEAIRIQLPAEFQGETDFLVKIEYQTGPDASALMWLPPELTAGGKNPFLFTQSQSIHARSWVPLQDSPGVRFTYEARTGFPGCPVHLRGKNPYTTAIVGPDECGQRSAGHEKR